MTSHPNISTVIFAEFDIDKGAVVRNQVPRPLAMEEQQLAELMLPDGVHNREEDWTVFFVRANAASTKSSSSSSSSSSANSKKTAVPAKSIHAARVFQLDDTAHDWKRLVPDSHHENLVLQSGTGSMLIKDESGNVLQTVVLERGSVSFDLVDPQHEQGIFCSLSPSAGICFGLLFLSEREQRTFADSIQAEIQVEPSASTEDASLTVTLPLAEVTIDTPPADFLYCMSFCTTRKDKNIKRGAVVRSVAFASTHKNFFAFAPALPAMMEEIQLASVPEVALIGMLDRLNSLTIPSPMDPFAGQVLRWSIPTASSMKRRYTKLALTGAPSGLFFPRVPETIAVDDPRVSAVRFVETFRDNVLFILDAIMCQRRVVFLGRQRAAADVVFLVLSTLQALSPEVFSEDVVTQRLFPYVSLSNLDFLAVPGFIAGVTHPMFELRTAWWDVLCDIDNQRVFVSPMLLGLGTDLQQQPLQPRVASELEKESMKHVLNRIAALRIRGTEAPLMEDWVRLYLRDYSRNVAVLALANDYSDADKNIAPYCPIGGREVISPETLKQWRLTPQHSQFRDSFAASTPTADDTELMYFSLQRRVFRLRTALQHHMDHCINPFRVLDSIPAEEILTTLQRMFKFCSSSKNAHRLLGLFPHAYGGLEPVACCIFHPSDAVRLATVALFRRLDTVPEGKECISALNMWFVLAYDRNARSFPDTEKVVTPMEQSNSVDKFSSQ